jgi:hypothetical protein
MPRDTAIFAYLSRPGDRTAPEKQESAAFFLTIASDRAGR